MKRSEQTKSEDEITHRHVLEDCMDVGAAISIWYASSSDWKVVFGQVGRKRMVVRLCA